jgi:phenylpyruvate tautomerase PptA (4-oxalocrotonate tautomerase family)
MPQVNITVIGAPPSAGQKAVLFKSITDLMVDILGRSRKSVVVSVTSAAPSDWSVAGAVQDSGGLAGVQAVVRVLTGTGSDEEKARMIEETTDVLRRVLGNPVMPFYVTFEEIPSTSWGYDGRTVADIAKARQAR